MNSKHHTSLPTCLLLAFLATIGACSVSETSNPFDSGIRNNMAVGTMSFISPEVSVSQNFSVLIPAPVSEQRFLGTIRSSDPQRPDVVAYVRCEYKYSDQFTLDSSNAEDSQKTTTVFENGQRMDLSISSTSIREFPIRRDENGFFHGSFPWNGKSQIDHRFRSLDLHSLPIEALQYFTSIIPDAAHDHRQSLLECGAISLRDPAG